MSSPLRLGVLTGGGDCPGLNAAIRAVVRAGESTGYEVVGIRDGWRGVLEADCGTLTWSDVRDIHGGGADLIFPHHENEIAQSEAFLGQAPFARFWVHNGLLRLGGEKMSKSLGNFVRLREILDRGLGAAFRLMVLQSHYRAPLTYTEEGLLGAERGLARLRSAASDSVPPATDGSETPDGAGAGAVDLPALAVETERRFHAAMSDDFDTPGAVAALFELGRAINRARAAREPGSAIEPARRTLIELADVLGLRLAAETTTGAADAAPFIDLLVGVRDELRAAKQWALSDRIRDGLAERGIAVEDGAAGSTWTRRKA